MKRLDHYWYDKNPLAVTLLPLSWLFRLLAASRRAAYQRGWLTIHNLGHPVIVVGNIGAGGSGKTPLVIWLTEFLRQNGYTPGIISRGYGGMERHFPRRVQPGSDPVEVGDEAVLLARRCNCPVVIDPDRVRAARALVDTCDVIISDDGLQHYALGRSIEIAVVDALRGFGNGYCLPAGPLREPCRRLKSVDWVVSNGQPGSALSLPARTCEMSLVALGMRNLYDQTILKPVVDFRGATVHAVAGIGHPARFFAQLRALGLQIIEHPFPDHHRFTARDLDFDGRLPIIMTEKDAVKCRGFAQPGFWYMPVQAQLADGFGESVLELLTRKIHGQEVA